MQTSLSFGAVLEAADILSLEEKETLVDILNHRIAEDNRQQVIEEVKEARLDFSSGACQEATVDELMQAILS